MFELAIEQAGEFFAAHLEGRARGRRRGQTRVQVGCRMNRHPVAPFERLGRIVENLQHEVERQLLAVILGAKARRPPLVLHPFGAACAASRPAAPCACPDAHS